MKPIHATSTGKRIPNTRSQRVDRTKAKAKPLPGYKKRAKR